MSPDEFNRLLRKYQMEQMSQSFNDADPSDKYLKDQMLNQDSNLQHENKPNVESLMKGVDHRVKEENLLPKKENVDILSDIDKEQKQYMQPKEPNQQSGMSDSIERIRLKLLGHK